MVQLTDELLHLLDERAAKEGVSRSQVIREAVQAYLTDERRADVDRRIVDSYTRAPQGGKFDVDEWGDLAGYMDALSGEGLRALAEEEREAGDEPW